MRDNGLTAEAYTSLGRISPALATPALTALAKAGIAAYCQTPAEAAEASTSLPQPNGAEGEATADATGAGELAGKPAVSARTADPADAAQSGREADPADGKAEAAEATTSPLPQPSAEGAATAEAADGSGLAGKPALSARTADPTDGGAEAAEATSSPLPEPSGAGGAAKAETADGESAEATSALPKAGVPVGFEEIFVAAQAVVRARAVIARSSEDAEWASLVEQFNAPSAEGHGATPVPRWPASEDVEEGSYEPLIDVPAGLIVGDTDEEPPEEPPARRTDDPHDHFIPPEPPRGPRLDWISRLAWLGLFGGPLLLIAAALLDFGTGRVTTVAVVGFVGGFLTLVLRMPDKLPPEDTPDDGAVV
ncbi:hypothetical protein [Kribbella sp. CA-294648]|uniref:hypothetical protein n=1 Tax=Kribbella sp. CA-294648 TaxID=3239948 RepID=UPI003D8A9B0D